MQKELIEFISIESYPNIKYTCVDGVGIRGITVKFQYKSMIADIILLYEDFKTDNPTKEEIKDKIIEVINS